MRHLFCLLMVAISYAAPGFVAAEEVHPRSLVVDINQKEPEFLVRVAVDRKDRIYKEGETLSVSVTSERSGYLYVFNVNSAGTITCLFPNVAQQDNRIAARKPVVIPDESLFKIRVAGPFGPEIVKAVVTTEKLTTIDVEQLLKKPTRLDAGAIKSLVVEITDRDRKNRELPPARRTWCWAEHAVEITTVATEQARSAQIARPRRVAVCVGVSVYQRGFLRLGVCAWDAQRFAEVLRLACGFDEVIVIPNEEATLRRIELTLRQEVIEKTRPGDTVLLFWSGHGGRVMATATEVKFDYLVPHDGLSDKVEQTMLLPNQLGRWLQALDGRKVMVILDACHAGGLTPTKGEPEALAGNRPFFFQIEEAIGRLKALSQADLALLTSCKANQKSYIRKENDHSVMSFYLLGQLQAGKEALTLKQLHTNLVADVERYVNNVYKSVQTPDLSGAESLLIRP